MYNQPQDKTHLNMYAHGAKLIFDFYLLNLKEVSFSLYLLQN